MATATVTPDTAPDQRRQRERAAGTPPSGPARDSGTDRPAPNAARPQRAAGHPPVLRLAGYDEYDGYDGSEREAAADGDWHICRGID
ncbi:hypothetical protein DMH02_008430 [Streptomyces sp. WAC 00631]|uniref:hypothetical protein n=1 Tax=Streptomyces sp. WAC 00631 TaxID=2203201 RepID=UPI000F791604|nr:hypothetical protein [Streptomyces sp. WAC 00631]MCC5033243.1 hypothetical protein [Streptomyces sp. WAC 00631]